MHVVALYISYLYTRSPFVGRARAKVPYIKVVARVASSQCIFYQNRMLFMKAKLGVVFVYKIPYRRALRPSARASKGSFYKKLGVSSATC